MRLLLAEEKKNTLLDRCADASCPSLGRYACPGKLLALSELSLLVAVLVSKYRVRFPEGDDGSRVEDEMIDQFTALPGPLDLIFEARKHA